MNPIEANDLKKVSPNGSRPGPGSIATATPGTSLGGSRAPMGVKNA
jgi:hypothetical protein